MVKSNQESWSVIGQEAELSPQTLSLKLTLIISYVGKKNSWSDFHWVPTRPFYILHIFSKYLSGASIVLDTMKPVAEGQTIVFIYTLDDIYLSLLSPLNTYLS